MQHTIKAVSGQWRTICKRQWAHCWCSHQSKGLHRRLHQQHDGSNDWPPRNNEQRQTRSSDRPCNWGSGPTIRPQQTYPSRGNGSVRKLIAEGGLMETKMILGWLFNFRTLTVALPEHKYIAWSQEINQMIKNQWTMKKQLESTIVRIGHIGFVTISWVVWDHYLRELGIGEQSASTKRA